MNTDEFLKELSDAYGIMNRISTVIGSEEGILKNPSYVYLKDKMEAFCITADHVLGQLKNRTKEQKYGDKRNQ